MSGCFDRENCPYVQCPDLSERRNHIASILSGTIFFIAWWIIIDVAANDPLKSHTYHICGVVSTIALFMVNAVSNAQVRGEMLFENSCLGQTGSRIWLLVGFLLSFGGLIGACFILFGVYVASDDLPKYPGIAVFLQNAFIFFSALIFKFGRSEEN